ncbi:MAG: alpha/beta fold hydrolase, partial [Candidatus Brockarchaeota archaeon]|nr:alpha/beta fold hydrolase [Candidatus Brockarchaeota archaeon]
MAASRAKFLGLCLLLSIYFLGIGTAFLMDRDFGRVEVRMIAIPDVGKRISGLLYRPVGATPENPLPAVVLTHGISGSKQMVSGIALELAKRGFVALAIDLGGHGNSEGAFGSDLSDPSLGILAAVRHLRAQPYVDGSRVGLVGHSLGAGAVRAAAFANGNVSASVFVGGGLGGVAEGPSYGEINRTFPKNLLVAVGAHDVLFDLGGLTMELGPAFGAPREVDPCVLYGDFSLGTARKLVTPPTTHLFEPVDPSIVSEIVLWMEGALGGGSSPRPDSEVKLSYAYREAAVSSSLAAFVGLIFSISSIIFDSRPPQVRKAKAARGTLEGWNAAAIWGALGLAAFLPMFLVGFFIQFPPLIFGSSFAWWLLAVAALGFLLIALVVPRVSSARTDLKASILESFAWTDVAVAA